MYMGIFSDIMTWLYCGSLVNGKANRFLEGSQVRAASDLHLVWCVKGCMNLQSGLGRNQLQPLLQTLFTHDR